jgi:hypothetical protein
MRPCSIQASLSKKKKNSLKISWAILSKEKEKEKNNLKIGCRCLEVMLMEFFSKAGWNVLKGIIN